MATHRFSCRFLARRRTSVFAIATAATMLATLLVIGPVAFTAPTRGTAQPAQQS